MRYRVRLRKIFYPEKLCVSQFHRLAEHFEQTEEDRDLDHHRQTAADRINTVLLVKLHHLLVHPGWIIFVFFAQLLHFRVERSHLAHGAIGFVLDWPKREFDDGGQSQDSQTVVMQPTVQQVHEVEQKLAHHLEHPEVHDLGFIVRKLRQTMIKLRASIDFETRAVGLAGLQMKSRHPERTLNPEQFLVRRAFDLETPAPNAICLIRERRHQDGEELIAYCHPFRISDSLLVIGSGCALAQTEKTTTATKPSHVDSFRPSENRNVSSDAPDQTRE